MELKKYAEEGQWTWKVAAFIAGLLIMTVSFLSLLSNLFGLSPIRLVLSLYIFAFGAITCILEYKDKLLTTKFIHILRREALFITRPYGRAGYYIFVGLLVSCQGGFLSFFIGLYTLVVGLIIFQSSRQAMSSLRELRTTDDEEISRKFREFDKDNSGIS